MNTLLVEIGTGVPAKNVAASCPNKDSLSAMMDEEDSRTLVIIR